MSGNFRLRFWFEITSAVAGGCLFVITLAWRDWLEIVFRIDPDHGSGWLEWLVAAAFFGLAVASSAGARREWNYTARFSAAGRAR